MPTLPAHLDSISNVIDYRTVVRVPFHAPAEPFLERISRDIHRLAKAVPKWAKTN